MIRSWRHGGEVPAQVCVQGADLLGELEGLSVAAPAQPAAQAAPPAVVQPVGRPPIDLDDLMGGGDAAPQACSP